MGQMFGKILQWRLWPLKDVRILMLGLDMAGKTSVLYRLRLNEVVVTIPTIGFNVESVEHKGFRLNLWDLGYGANHSDRVLRRHYYANTQGIVFVVDSSDRERIEEAKEELHKLLMWEELLKNVPLLVLANKCDLPDAMPPQEITHRLALPEKIPESRPWRVQHASALKGLGLHEGLNWLATTLGTLSSSPHQVS